MTKIAQLKHILTMLETVQADDTAVLDEIDCLYWCATRLDDRFKFSVSGRSISYRSIEWPKEAHTVLYHLFDNYLFTRSRDLLKLERPVGWDWLFYNVVVLGAEKTMKVEFGKSCTFNSMETPELPTEEIAELHAIIQAKIWILENEDE